MKVFLLALLSSVVFVEGNPFTDAHSHLHPVFLDQKNYLDGVRVAVGAYSEIVSFDLVEIVATEISGWESRGKTCQENIFRPRNTEEIGEALRMCVDEFTDLFHTIQDTVWEKVEEAQVETHDIQLALMRQLQREDVLEVSENFYDNAVEMGSQLMDRFYNVRYPELRTHVEELEWAVENLPQLLQGCIAEIPRKFTMFC